MKAFMPLVRRSAASSQRIVPFKLAYGVALNETIHFGLNMKKAYKNTKLSLVGAARCLRAQEDA
jgi:hypothetical protein